MIKHRSNLIIGFADNMATHKFLSPKRAKQYRNHKYILLNPKGIHQLNGVPKIYWIKKGKDIGVMNWFQKRARDYHIWRRGVNPHQRPQAFQATIFYAVLLIFSALPFASLFLLNTFVL